MDNKMKFRWFALLLLLLSPLGAADIQIYKSQKEGTEYVSYQIGKSKLNESDFRILKIIAELQTFTDGLVHPFIGDIYYFAIFQDGQQVGKVIQFAYVEGKRSGSIYLHERKATEKLLMAEKEDSTTYIPLYSKEVGDILTKHLKVAGIVKTEESIQAE